MKDGWTEPLPEGNLYARLTAVGLIYGLGILVGGRLLLTLDQRIVVGLAAIPGLAAVLLLRESRAWIAGDQMHIRNGWRSSFTVDAHLFRSVAWHNATWAPVGWARVELTNGSRHAIWSTFGTNGFGTNLESNFTASLKRAGWLEKPI